MLGNIIIWCNILFCPAYGIICRQTIPYAKHTENIAQQSDLFAAINVVCEQTNPYAEHTGIFVQQSDLFAAVSAVWEQMFPYAEHTENSVSYPDFFAAQFLAFRKIFDRRSASSTWQLLQSKCSSKSFSSPPFRI